MHKKKIDGSTNKFALAQNKNHVVSYDPLIPPDVGGGLCMGGKIKVLGPPTH